MTARGKPERERGGGPNPETANHHPKTTRHHPDGSFDASTPGRGCVTGRCARRGADLWREGYCYGFLAALRDVARATNDPDVWCVLGRVGENITPPAADDYGLVR